jgi:transcription factor CP2-like protein
VKLPNESVYRAVYLNHLTIQDLISKLSEKLEIQAQSIVNVTRYTAKRNITVRLDDESVQQIDDEQDMEVDYQIVQDSFHLRLTY